MTIHSYQYPECQLLVTFHYDRASKWSVLSNYCSQEELIEHYMSQCKYQLVGMDVVELTPESFDLLAETFAVKNILEGGN